MDLPVLSTVLRQILLAAGSYFVTKGIIADEATLQAVVGGVVALVSVVWGVFSKTKDTAKVEAAQTVLTQADAGVTTAQVATAAAKLEENK